MSVRNSGATVLVTTSGLGERLGELTDYTNKSLLAVGDQPVLSRILNLYPADTHFVITLGYKGDLVRQYVELSHPELNVTWQEVKRFEGPGSSLAFTILQAEKKLQNPFIFHAGDAILLNEFDHTVNENWLCGAPGEDSTLYSSLQVKGDLVTRVCPKREREFDYLYPGVAGIYNYEKFFHALKSVVLSNSDKESNDLSAIMLMMADGESFRLRVVNDWIDTGSISGLKKANESFENQMPTLPKSQEAIFLIGNRVLKFFADSTDCENRVARTKNLHGMIPNLIGHSQNWYSYQYVQGETASSGLRAGEATEILEWGQNSIWRRTKKIDEDFVSRCRKFYLEKSMERVNRYQTNSGVTDIEEKINGVLVPSARELISTLGGKEAYIGIPSFFHGDFVLDNIIRTPHGFVAIDWRQDFADSIKWGDVYYDLAKFAHSLTMNHRALIGGMYEVKSLDEEVFVEIWRKNSLVIAESELEEFCVRHDYDMNRVRLLQGLIWINMAALHGHPMDELLMKSGRLQLHHSLLRI